MPVAILDRPRGVTGVVLTGQDNLRLAMSFRRKTAIGNQQPARGCSASRKRCENLGLLAEVALVLGCGNLMVVTQ